MVNPSMREKLNLLIELLPELTISDLKYIYNLSKMYAYAQERLNRLTSDNLEYRDEKAITFTSLNLKSLEWAIEIICKESFDKINSICNM